MVRRAALYVRVSTTGQTTDNQLAELEAVARRHVWEVVEVFSDRGVSGVKDRRPGLDGLRRGVARRDFDVVAAWSVDRLSRSLTNLLGFLEDLKAKGVDLYLHQQGLDTGTPAGKAMLQMCGVFAEFERELIKERVKAGMARARAAGKRIGRPRVPARVELKIRRELAGGRGVVSVARALGVGTGTVQRVKRELAS
jgi:DNA invertase Pin-like site-specific DNA recombinase